MASAHRTCRPLPDQRPQNVRVLWLCWRGFWGLVWLWYGARALRTANRIRACQQPFSGRVLNAYSGDELVYNKTLGDWRTHNGVDYAAKAGAEVTSPVAGKVTLAGTEGSWGPVVALEDSAGRVWRLCGVADPQVEPGQRVSAGDVLGTVGIVGCECAEESHIHLEVKQGETYLDPARALT